jgi:hypothetical protein
MSCKIKVSCCKLRHIFHVKQHNSLKYTELLTKFQYFDVKVRKVRKLTGNIYLYCRLTSNFYASAMKCYNIIDANCSYKLLCKYSCYFVVTKFPCYLIHKFLQHTVRYTRTSIQRMNISIVLFNLQR